MTQAQFQLSLSRRLPKYTSTADTQQALSTTASIFVCQNTDFPSGDVFVAFLAFELTEKDVEQGEEAEGDGDGQLGVDGEAQNHGHRAAEEQGEEDHQPGELEQRLYLLACKRLHLICRTRKKKNHL